MDHKTSDHPSRRTARTSSVHYLRQNVSSLRVGRYGKGWFPTLRCLSRYHALAERQHLNLSSSLGTWCQDLAKAPHTLCQGYKIRNWKQRRPSKRTDFLGHTLPLPHSLSPGVVTNHSHQVLQPIFLTWHMPTPPGQQQRFLFACVGCVGLCPKSPLAKSTARFQFHWDSQQAPWSSSKAGSREGSSIAPQQLCYREKGLFDSGTE